MGEIRERAEAGLGRGMPTREAALARGFVLGEDEGIDAATVEDFRRAGLSHLLAVSGQNVALLGLLAMPLLALLGLPLRARLLWAIGLIAVYVPLAGAGPSIQRAAVMGALSLFATLAGRRSSRLHALAVAAIVTLAIDPGIAHDVGWELSFAAVLGIVLLARPLAVALATRLGLRGPLGGALADGAAMTTAATLATAPLIAFHFGELSLVTLLANLLALPAVAPAMWLGMLAAAASQVPGLPVEAVNALNAPLLAYVAEVAARCARPGWASVELRLGAGGLALAYAAIAGGALLARSRPLAAVRAGVAFLAVVSVGVAIEGEPPAAAPPAGLRVVVLDVGQGDAILLRPPRSPAVLVDGGPPGEGLARMLRDTGVERLGAAIVTHDQSDHAGGIGELVGSMPIGSLLYAELGSDMRAEAGAAGVPTRRVAAGSRLRSGALRLDVLWPPAVLLGPAAAAEDPNRLSLVILARWRGFSMLLCGDAEAEATPIDPGPVDVLKVAHHGSEDAGLDALLERSFPRLAVISVGDENSYGHPTAATLATLAGHGVRTLRTDRDGAIVIESLGRGLRARAER